jgi:hypothetical protein
MKLTILANGNLEISLDTEDDREDIASWSEGDHWERMFEECGAIGNGWTMIAPEWIGALTDAPIVSDDCDLGDDAKLTRIGRVWWFPNYMIEDPIVTLVTSGRVVFRAAPENKVKS